MLHRCVQLVLLAIQSAVNSRLGTFMSKLYEACGEDMIPLRGYDDCIVESSMAAIQGKLLPLRGGVDAVRRRIQLPFLMDLPESDLCGADIRTTSGSGFQYPINSINSFSIPERLFCRCIISPPTEIGSP